VLGGRNVILELAQLNLEALTIAGGFQDLLDEVFALLL